MYNVKRKRKHRVHYLEEMLSYYFNSHINLVRVLHGEWYCYDFEMLSIERELQKWTNAMHPHVTERINGAPRGQVNCPVPKGQKESAAFRKKSRFLHAWYCQKFLHYCFGEGGRGSVVFWFGAGFWFFLARGLIWGFFVVILLTLSASFFGYPFQWKMPTLFLYQIY